MPVDEVEAISTEASVGAGNISLRGLLKNFHFTLIDCDLWSEQSTRFTASPQSQSQFT